MLLASASTDTNPKKPLNKHYESDLQRSIQYSRWFLQFLGMWPMISKNVSKAQKYFYKIMMAVCFFGINFTLVPLLLNAFLTEKNPIVRVWWFLGPISSGLGTNIKYMFLIIRRENIRLCMEDMESDWMTVENENERAIMMKNVNVARRITFNACTLIYTSGTFYLTMSSISKGTSMNERNETIRPLPFPGYNFFGNPQKSPTYEILFFAICATSLIRFTITMAVCNFAAVFISHACGQIQIVMARLNSLFDEPKEGKPNDTIQERISSVVYHHVKCLRLSKRIDDVLRELCLIEIAVSTLGICFFTYNIQTKRENTQTLMIVVNFLFMTSYILNIFIFCYIGELLKEQGLRFFPGAQLLAVSYAVIYLINEFGLYIIFCHQYYEVAKSTYFIDWHKFPGRSGLAVVMIIAMANIPRKISAGRMMELSLATFGSIMKTSAAYLNMMRTMTD